MCRGPGGPPTQKTNYKSALDNFSVIDKMIDELVSNGWAEGPFDQLPFENYYLNALAAVPKRDSTDLRLIVDCRRSNVNSKIPDQPFKFKLSDFNLDDGTETKPESGTFDPFSQSALPPTPDVNPEMIQPAVQQASLTQTGLTPSEQALLSPEEQAIRLRQRGMA